MKPKPFSFLLVLLFFLMGLFFYGCVTDNIFSGKTGESEAEQKAELEACEILVNQLTAETEALEGEVAKLQERFRAMAGTGTPDSLLMVALEVMELFQDRDMEGLALFVHPDQGVRFSPYGYVNLQEDLVFKTQDIPVLMQDSRVYTWGAFDGTGEPINYTFSDYYDRFIYDADFADPHMIGNNTIIGTGNTLINLDQVYPDGFFVEFHFTGFDPEYDGMDWRSLRLVFEKFNSSWYLVGIVHDEWTI